MDRLCNGCVYQTFVNSNNWGFCSCDKISIRTLCPDDCDILDSYASRKLHRLPPDVMPSCMLVQSYFGGRCPNFQTSDADDASSCYFCRNMYFYGIEWKCKLKHPTGKACSQYDEDAERKDVANQCLHLFDTKSS